MKHKNPPACMRSMSGIIHESCPRCTTYTARPSQAPYGYCQSIKARQHATGRLLFGMATRKPVPPPDNGTQLTIAANISNQNCSMLQMNHLLFMKYNALVSHSDTISST